MSYVHEGCIERWHQFFDTTVVDISHCEGVHTAFFAIDLHESVVFGQRNSNLLWRNIHNQFAFHMSMIVGKIVCPS